MKQNLSNPPKDSFYNLLALILCFLNFTFWIILLSYKFYHFGYYDWDLGISANVLWNLTQGSMYSHPMGMNFLANHAEYIAFVLAPIYALCSHPLTVISLKLMSYILAAYFLFRLAKENLGYIYAILVMVMFLTYPTIIFSTLFEFHFEELGVGLIVLLYYFYKKNNYAAYCITMLLLGLIKENYPLIIICFGIFGLFSPKKSKLKWGVIPIIWGLFMFVLSMYIIMPYLRQQIGLKLANQYLVQFKELGTTPVEISKTFIFQPQKILKTIIEPHRLQFLKELFEPLLYLPFLSPHILFLGAASFLQNLLSKAFQHQMITFHYTATLTPVIFMAYLNTLTFIKNRSGHFLFKYIFILVFIMSLANSVSYSDFYKIKLGVQDKRLTPLKWQMIQQIPEDKGVIASLEFFEAMTNRKSLYSFYNVAQNSRGLTFKAFEIPEDLSFAMLNFEDPWVATRLTYQPSKYIPRLKELFEGKAWYIEDAAEDIVLLSCLKNEGVKLVEKTTSWPAEDKVKVIIDNRFGLISAEVGNDPLPVKRNVLPLTFVWKSHEVKQKNYGMVLILKKDGKTVLKRKRRIGYLIYPTSSWKKDDYIKEHYWLLLPDHLSGALTLQVQFYNINSGKTASLNKPGEPAFPGTNSITLGKIVIEKQP